MAPRRQPCRPIPPRWKLGTESRLSIVVAENFGRYPRTPTRPLEKLGMWGDSREFSALSVSPIVSRPFLAGNHHSQTKEREIEKIRRQVPFEPTHILEWKPGCQRSGSQIG